MAVEAEVLNELHRLRHRLPQLVGALAASVDGLVLAQDLPDARAEGLAALTAAALGVGHRIVDLTARGEFCELLVRGDAGYVATYAAGPSAVLTLLAGDRANVGRLHLEGRRSGAVIAGLMESRRPAIVSTPSRPAPPQNRALGSLPVRIPQQFGARPGTDPGA